VNCIVWGNRRNGSTSQGAQIAGPLIVSYSCIQNWAGGGIGNTADDPLLVDPANGDYHIAPGSPCIDAADNTGVPPEITTDLDGNPRFVDDPNTPDTGNGDPPIVDMGAYEFQPELVITAKLDIKPGSCLDPVNVRSRGVVPMAVVGTAAFDVMQIDRSTLSLARADGVGGSVTPLNGPPGPGIQVEDAATPFEGELCDCHELTGDGIDDLGLKFSTPEMVAALELGSLPDRTELRLTVSGQLLDQTPFEASDCVILITPNPGGLSTDEELSPPASAGVDPSPSSHETPLSDEQAARTDRDPAAEERDDEPLGLNVPFSACGALPAAMVLLPIVGLGLNGWRRFRRRAS
jgi:hypothetical protein